MPANVITVNGVIEYTVPDSRMDEILKLLVDSAFDYAEIPTGKLKEDLFEPGKHSDKD